MDFFLSECSINGSTNIKMYLKYSAASDNLFVLFKNIEKKLPGVQVSLNFKKKIISIHSKPKQNPFFSSINLEKHKVS